MPTILKRPRFLLMLMLLATLLAGLAQWALSARDAKAAPVAAAPAAPTGIVLMSVAASLPPGHLIQPGDLAELPWRSETLPAGAITAGSAAARALVGSVTRRAFSGGELVLPGAVILPGEHGFLSALIAPGHRAIAVAVDAATSAGGLIWPGDRVDVVLTQELRDDDVPLGQRVLGETILSDVRVLSTDQKLDPAGQASSDPTATTMAVKSVPATVTLEVTPAGAERVTVGGTLGRLHLTLRAVASEAALAPSAATWASVVSPGLAAIRRQPKQALSAAPVAAAPAASPAASSASGDIVRIYRGSNGVVK